MNKKILILVLALISSVNLAFADTGPYTSKIKVLQVTDVGEPYNTVFLLMDIKNSPCGNTNQVDRFSIKNNAQHSTILAAVMSNKEITIYGEGICNSANIETIRNIRIKPQS